MASPSERNREPRSRPYEPLKITAHLAAPLAGEPPMLDSVLEWQVSFHWLSIANTRNGHRHTFTPRLRGQPVEEPGKLPIPIVRRQAKGFQWPIPACSSPIISPVLDSQEHYSSQFALDLAYDLLDESEHVVLQTTGGPFKSYRLPIRIRLCDRIVWFAFGAARPTRQLCNRVFALGKKTSYGYGRVLRWEVERVDDDWSWFAPGPGGERVLMRPLPVEEAGDCVGGQRWFGAPCPPYWQRNFYTEIARPIL